MLDQGKLKQEILNVLNDIIPPALEQAMLSSFCSNNDVGKKAAKTFAQTFKDIANDALADGLASAIDYHVHSAEVFGQMMLVGIPTVGGIGSHTSLPHMVSSQTMPTGQGGGAIPGPNKFIFGIK